MSDQGPRIPVDPDAPTTCDSSVADAGRCGPQRQGLPAIGLAAVAGSIERFVFPSVTGIEGLAADQAAGMTMIGARPSTRYFAGQFISQTEREQPRGHVSIISLARKLDDYRRESDLVLGRVLTPVARLLTRQQDVLVMPVMVQPRLRLPLTEARRTQLRKRQRDNLRKIRKGKFSWQVSTKDTDLEYFWERMYRPFVANRFGDRAALMPRRRLRHFFRRGGIMWVMQDGRPVAGEIFAQHGTVLRSIVAATLDGSQLHIESGAFAATYQFLVELAEERGFAFLDWGGCEASLANGVLTTKKRWGAELYCKPRPRYELFVTWQKFGPAIRRFLNHTPLIIRQGDRLAGLGAMPCDGPVTIDDVVAYSRRYWISGLDRMVVVAEVESSHTGQSGGESSPVWLAAPGSPRACLASARPIPGLQADSFPD
jgi:hypothetical protein